MYVCATIAILDLLLDFLSLIWYKLLNHPEYCPYFYPYKYFYFLTIFSLQHFILFIKCFCTLHDAIFKSFYVQYITNLSRFLCLSDFFHNIFLLQHFIRLAASQGFSMEVVAELKYELPKVHKFHKQKSKDIEVDLYRFSHNS
jgi:hypothetical protein